MNLLISDRCELESAPIVESVQWKLIQCLQYLVEHFHPEEPRKFSQCLQLLTDLRDVSEQHQQRTIKGQYDDYTMDIIKDHPLIYEALEDSMSCLKTSWQYSEDRVLLNKGMLKSWEFRRHFYKDFFINLFLFSFFYAHLHLFANHRQIYSDSSQCQIFCLFLFIFISPLEEQIIFLSQYIQTSKNLNVCAITSTFQFVLSGMVLLVIVMLMVCDDMLIYDD